jgi:hypothetical protein
VRVLITEVNLDNPDYVELTNFGTEEVELNGWQFTWHGISPSDGSPVSGTFVVPETFVVQAGGRAVFYDNYGGTDIVIGENTITFAGNINWGMAEPDAAVLADAEGIPQDFLRWGASTIEPPSPLSWSDTPSALVPDTSGDYGLSRISDEDNDIAGDFCVALATPLLVNAACE